MGLPYLDAPPSYEETVQLSPVDGQINMAYSRTFDLSRDPPPYSPTDDNPQMMIQQYHMPQYSSAVSPVSASSTDTFPVQILPLVTNEQQHHHQQQFQSQRSRTFDSQSSTRSLDQHESASLQLQPASNTNDSALTLLEIARVRQTLGGGGGRSSSRHSRQSSMSDVEQSRSSDDLLSGGVRGGHDTDDPSLSSLHKDSSDSDGEADDEKENKSESFRSDRSSAGAYSVRQSEQSKQGSDPDRDSSASTSSSSSSCSVLSCSIPSISTPDESKHITPSHHPDNHQHKLIPDSPNTSPLSSSPSHRSRIVRRKLPTNHNEANDAEDLIGRLDESDLINEPISSDDIINEPMSGDLLGGSVDSNSDSIGANNSQNDGEDKESNNPVSLRTESQ